MSERDTSKTSQAASAPNQSGMKFQHQRAPAFRSIYAHGAWGGWAARNITLSFYNERPPLPASVIYEIEPNGQFAQKEPAIQQATDAQIVRQFEVEVFMSVETARLVHTVLGNFIKMAEQEQSSQTVK